MAKLTYHHRNSLPASDFGLPEKRAYPMPDASHARDALARVSEEEAKGNISHEDAERVRAMAHKILGDESKKTLVGSR